MTGALKKKRRTIDLPSLAGQPAAPCLGAEETRLEAGWDRRRARRDARRCQPLVHPRPARRRLGSWPSPGAWGTRSLNSAATGAASQIAQTWGARLRLPEWWVDPPPRGWGNPARIRRHLPDDPSRPDFAAVRVGSAQGKLAAVLNPAPTTHLPETTIDGADW